MRTSKEGINIFSNYDSVRFYIDYDKKGKSVKSLQITFGGYAYFDEATMKNELANYNVWIKRFFKQKSKDGYFKDRFIYINDLHNSFNIKSSGGMFPKVFLFLEEEYEKKFLVEYLRTLFEEINYYHKNHKSIVFKKYTERNEI